MKYRRYIKKFFISLATLFALSLVSFLLFLIAPGDPATLVAWERMGGEFPSPEIVEAVKEELGLDVPPHILYLKWLWMYLNGDWGRSFVTGQPVLELIADRFPMTALLAITAFLIAFPISLLTGFLAGIKKGSIADTMILVGLSLIDSLPSFFLGIVLMIVFAVKLHILPAAGYNSFENLILPAITLAAGYVAVTSRVTRASVVETLSKDYILTAKSKGLGKWLIIRRHVLRNSLIPVITYAGLELAWLLEGSVIVETLFAWPGMGSLLTGAILSKDLPVIQACMIVIGGLFITINAITDVLYTIINPEVRYQ
jgi:peptide/nickel transport system permease protein